MTNEREHTDQAATLSPITGAERIGELDVLRGFALCGVLVANVWLFFSGAFLRFPGLTEDLRAPSVDTFVYLAINVLISGKAMTTFGLLFGAGFAVQLERSEAKQARFGRFFARRMTALLLIGLLHALLLWLGDILHLYALCGFLLLLFRKRRDGTLLVWGLLLFFVVPVLVSALPLLLSLFGAGPPGPRRMGGAATTDLLLRIQEGGYLDWIRAHHELLLIRAPVWALGLLQSLCAFLVGAWAIRRQLVQRARTRPDALRVVAILGLGAGLLLATIITAAQYGPWEFPHAPWTWTAQFAARTFSTALAAVGYIALALLLFQRDRWRPFLELFAPVGRMALTNYLAQSVICVLVFYAGGLFGRVGATTALAISLVIFAFQLAFSRWWLARFRFGPAEWLWRTVSYGRRQPMLREAAASR